MCRPSPHRQNRSLPIPGKFLYTVDNGNAVRNNLAFESLRATPNRKYLYTATENALQNDGPIASLAEGSSSRFLEFDADRKQPMREFVYVVDPIPNDSVPPGRFADNSLVDLQVLDNCGTFLAMERSYASGFGNTVVLFETTTKGTTDVSGDTVLDSYKTMTKRFIADFELDLGETPDNLEGLAIGPRLPDGRMLLIHMPVLAHIQVVVEAVLVEQRLVSAALDDPASIDHQHIVSLANSA